MPPFNWSQLVGGSVCLAVPVSDSPVVYWRLVEFVCHLGSSATFETQAVREVGL